MKKSSVTDLKKKSVLHSSGREVRKTMGAYQFQFIEIEGGSYRYMHNPKWFKMHKKWQPFKQYFRGRRYACVLTKEIPANSVSGSSYDIIGVFVIFETDGDCHNANEYYWGNLKGLKTVEQKLRFTIDFAKLLMDELDNIGLSHNYYPLTIGSLLELLPEEQPRPMAISTSTLVF